MRAVRFRLQSLDVGDLEVRAADVQALEQDSKAEKLGSDGDIHD